MSAQGGGKSINVLIRTVVGTAKQHAADVDAKARFPEESIEALRELGLMAACAPKEMGGAGLAVADLVAIASGLARACGSTAMIWSMHQGQLACLCQYHGGRGGLLDLAGSAIAEQWLIASATSEAGVGGDIRRSGAALEPRGPEPDGGYRLVKDATTVSYGAFADLLLVTARASPEALATDQSLAAVRASRGSLEQSGVWETLGMRGTCSPGFRISADIEAQHVFPVPFADIAATVMVPLTQLLWAAVWVGLAGEALDRAVRLVRRKAAGTPGYRAQPALAQARWRLAAAQALVSDSVERTQSLLNGAAPSTLGTAVRTNSLKVAVSEIALEVAHQALRVCGMAGYSEQGPYSVARIIRDLSSAPVMIGNDRILDGTAQLMLVERQDVG